MPYTDQGVGYADRDTSRGAADRPSVKTVRARVLRLFKASGGLTADEAAAALDMHVLTVRPRVTELYHEGKLYATEERRMGTFGRNQIVWRAVE